MFNPAVSIISSVRGVDQLLWHAIDLVKEPRLYAPLDRQCEPGEVFFSPTKLSAGMVAVRSRLGALRCMLSQGGFDESYVHRTGDLLAIHRHCAATGDSVALFARCALRDFSPALPEPVELEGASTELLLAASVTVMRDESEQTRDAIAGSDGSFALLQTRVAWRDGKPVVVARSDDQRDDESFVAVRHRGGLRWTLEFGDRFVPGAIVVVRMSASPAQRDAVAQVSALYAQPTSEPRAVLQRAMSRLSMLDLGTLLYRTDSEERAISRGERGW